MELPSLHNEWNINTINMKAFKLYDKMQYLLCFSLPADGISVIWICCHL